MREKNIKILRWFFLLPVSFTVSLLAMFVMIILFKEVINDSLIFNQYDSYVFGVVTSIGGILGILVSYFIAPDYKKVVLWIMFSVGSILICFVFHKMFHVSNLPKALTLFITILVIFLVALLLHFQKDFLNEIERS